MQGQGQAVPSPMSLGCQRSCLSLCPPLVGHPGLGWLSRPWGGEAEDPAVCRGPPGHFFSFPQEMQQSKPSHHDGLCLGAFPKPSSAPSCPSAASQPQAGNTGKGWQAAVPAQPAMATAALSTGLCFWEGD